MFFGLEGAPRHLCGVEMKVFNLIFERSSLFSCLKDMMKGSSVVLGVGGSDGRRTPRQRGAEIENRMTVKRAKIA